MKAPEYRRRGPADEMLKIVGLTEVALGLGYPDSHFSHSIRSTFGIQPGAIRAGSRGLLVRPGADYTLFAT